MKPPNPKRKVRPIGYIVNWGDMKNKFYPVIFKTMRGAMESFRDESTTHFFAIIPWPIRRKKK